MGWVQSIIYHKYTNKKRNEQMERGHSTGLQPLDNRKVILILKTPNNFLSMYYFGETDNRSTSLCLTCNDVTNCKQQKESATTLILTQNFLKGNIMRSNNK